MKGAQKPAKGGGKGGAKKKTRPCTIEIEIDSSDTIETVKAKICQTGGTPAAPPNPLYPSPLRLCSSPACMAALVVWQG
jgi:hypothetical protein